MPELIRFIPYFEHPHVTITLVAGATCVQKLDPRHDKEVLIVRDAAYPFAPKSCIALLRRTQKPNPRQLYYLSNTEEMHEHRLAFGFNSHFINIGCFIDDACFSPGPKVKKQYDAVMTASFTTLKRGSELKRHYLTTDIERLALLDPVYSTDDSAYRKRYRDRPNCRYFNDARLSPDQVADVLRQSWCGLALTAREGVCRASSEYLLTGIPVVSTKSRGGRDMWYDGYNSIIVEPTTEAVHAAVERLKADPRDPQRIRSDYLTRAAVFKARFRNDVLAAIFSDFGVDQDVDEMIRGHPFRWW